MNIKTCKINLAAAAVALLTLMSVNSALAQGALANGSTTGGTITLVGEAHSWTFSATNGDAIVIRVGDVTNLNLAVFTPRLRLFSPSAVQIATDFGSSAAEVAVTATNTGTFTVVVDDLSGTGGGAYRLTLAKTGSAVNVASGDTGGLMTNGYTHTGMIDTGDIDIWTFNANVGEAIVVRMGEITDTNVFFPWVRIYGPNGVLLDSGANQSVGEVTARATNSGAFLVVVSDGNGTRSGSGAYRLTLAKTGSPLLISAGDEGGQMSGVSSYSGTIGTGDLDAWTFTAFAGDNIVLQMNELSGTNVFTPWLRIYNPAGVLIANDARPIGTTITELVTNSGTFLVIAGDGNGIRGGTGTYSLTVNGLSDATKLGRTAITGTNVTITAVGGTAGAGLVLLTSTNIATPAASWSPIQTNSFDQYGVFNLSSQFNPAEPKRFFRLALP